METDLAPLDIIDSGETFNPQSLEHWVLVLLSLAFAIGGYIWIDRQSKRPLLPTHRYDKETGKIEPIDED